MMHCYSLAVLTILLMIVASSPLIPHNGQKYLTSSTSNSVSWTPARRQIHLGPQSTMIAELDGILLTKSTDTKFDVESTAAESTDFSTDLSSSAPFSQKSAETKNEKRQVSTQDSNSTDEVNLLGPMPPVLSVSFPVPTEHQVTAPAPTPLSGCTTTVMGDLHNPCAWSPKWTSTVTEYTAVDCHGCTSLHVVEPKWHCPVVITTVGPSTANGLSTLTSTICASTSTL